MSTLFTQQVHVCYTLQYRNDTITYSDTAGPQISKPCNIQYDTITYGHTVAVYISSPKIHNTIQ